MGDGECGDGSDGKQYIQVCESSTSIVYQTGHPIKFETLNQDSQISRIQQTILTFAKISPPSTESFTSNRKSLQLACSLL